MRPARCWSCSQNPTLRHSMAKNPSGGAMLCKFTYSDAPAPSAGCSAPPSKSDGFPGPQGPGHFCACLRIEFTKLQRGQANGTQGISAGRADLRYPVGDPAGAAGGDRTAGTGLSACRVQNRQMSHRAGGAAKPGGRRALAGGGVSALYRLLSERRGGLPPVSHRTEIFL